MSGLEVMVERPIPHLNALNVAVNICCSEVDARPHPGVNHVLVDVNGELVVPGERQAGTMLSSV